MNLLWSIIEGATFYTTGLALNDILFPGFLKTLPEDRQFLTVITDGMIRAAGFNIDPAHLGAIIPIVFIYGLFKRNPYLLGTSVISLIFSGSTTALVASACSLAISIPKLDLFTFKFRPKYTLSLLILLSCGGGLFFIEQIRASVGANISGFYDRVLDNYVEAPEQGPRYIYHAYLPEALVFNGVRTLIGTGFGTASYPYVGNPEIAKHLHQESYYPYDPESTYISYLFNTGIVGLSVYLYLLIRLLLRYRNLARVGENELIIYASLAGIFFSSFFYHYTLTAYQILIFIWAVTLYRSAPRKLVTQST